MKQNNAIIIVLLISILSILLYDSFIKRNTVLIRDYAERPESAARLQAVDQKFTIQSGNTNLVKAASMATPAVVYLRSITSVEHNSWHTSYTASAGSGVIISPDGYIITNRHLIIRGGKIEVILNDRREYTAELIGTDSRTDLALLKIEATDLPTLDFGNSNNAQVGEWVIAVGNPFKLHSTVTAGIISAIARDIPFSETDSEVNSFIQTDAVVNQGNSGGALVNEEGKLIGINSAILTQSGSFEGYSFAIPSNVVLKIIEDIREFGAVHRGELGIKGISVNSDMARAKSLPTVSGVYVDETIPGGSADKAGIRGGDIIREFNGKEVETIAHLHQKLSTFRPGDTINLTVFRNKESFIARTILKNKLNTVDILPVLHSTIIDDPGFEVRNLSKEEKALVKKNGIKVISIISGSKIARTKMDPGFVITKVNNVPVNDIRQLEGLLKNQKGRVILEGVYEKYEGEFWYVFTNED